MILFSCPQHKHKHIYILTVININTICKCCPPNSTWVMAILHKLMLRFFLILFMRSTKQLGCSLLAYILLYYTNTLDAVSLNFPFPLRRNTSASCPWFETVWPNARKKVSETSIWQSYLYHFVYVACKEGRGSVCGV